MTTWNVGAECHSCGNEQSQLVDVESDDPDDSEIRFALNEQAHDCDECGSNDWSPLNFKVNYT